MTVGTEVKIIGRVQSRNYEKKYEDGTVEQRVAYEVSVANLELKMCIRDRLEILNQEELITDKELKIFKSLVTDNCLSTIKIKKEEIRANILKNIIINL